MCFMDSRWCAGWRSAHARDDQFRGRGCCGRSLRLWGSPSYSRKKMDSRRLAEGGEWDLLRLRDVRPQTDRAHYGEDPRSSTYTS